MLSKIISATLHGIEALPITVETDISGGLPMLNVVGLADIIVKEARERIRSAILNSEMEYPKGRITVNMSPAGIRKKGSHFDLPMSVGILVSSGQIFDRDIEEYGFIGELSLDGSVNACSGVLPMVMALSRHGISKVIVPKANLEEAVLVKGVEVYPVTTLQEVSDHFNMKEYIEPQSGNRRLPDESVGSLPDFAEVKGQEEVKRAVTVAVAGGHGILMVGSPSTGKTMISKRLPSIMPKMSHEEIVETTMIYSVAGLLGSDRPYISQRPFRQPHHKITPVGLLGGGAYPRPGEITLAHKGVLFLDEVGEYDRNLIDMLRLPLEDKKVSLVRKGETYSFPADFLLVAATNPCKCGYYGDPRKECKCSAHDVLRYQSKLTGPILDRIDMHLRLQPVDYDQLSERQGLSSEDMKRDIEAARLLQRERYKCEGIYLNHQLESYMMDKYCRLDKEGESLLAQAYKVMELNPRTLMKTKKLARTIADLAGSERIEVGHLSEALQYREKRI